MPRITVTYHPAAILHGATSLKKDIVDDLRRVFDEPLAEPRDGIPPGPFVAIDTEYDSTGNLLTVAVSDPEVTLVEEDLGFPKTTEVLTAARFIGGHSVAGDVEKLVEYGFPVREEWASGIHTV